MGAMQTYAAPAPQITYAAPIMQAAPAVQYVSAAPAVVAAPINLGTMVAAPLQLGTASFQANLPSPYTMLPEYVAPQTFVDPVGLPTAASMVAYPGMSAMQGPFVFTAGAAYTGAPETIVAAPEGEKAKKVVKAKTGCC